MMAYDWYDIQTPYESFHNVLIYLDAEDLFFIGEDNRVVESIRTMVNSLTVDDSTPNDPLLSRFFFRLFRGEMDFLDRYEDKINHSMSELLTGNLDQSISDVIAHRRELLRLKHYYE